MNDTTLPTLPQPDGYAAMTESGTVIVPPRDFAKVNGYAVFTADQMREYALQAIAANATAPTQQAVPALPVKYEWRMRPIWRPEGEGWTNWQECCKDSYENYLRLPVYNDWQYEARALYAAAQPAQAHCKEGGRCVCGGDTPGVRATCDNWMKP